MLRQAFIVRESDEVAGALEAAYDETHRLLKFQDAAVCRRMTPEEVSQMHNLLVLIRLGYVRIHSIYARRDKFIVLEVDPPPDREQSKDDDLPIVEDLLDLA